MQNYQDAIRHLRNEAYQLSDQDRDEEAGSLLAAVEALTALAATPAPAAPLAERELSWLIELEKQATPAPWTAWAGNTKIFYGVPEVNTPGQYSPANLQLFDAEDYDREDADEVQAGTAEDDAAFVAALRNALPGLLARLAAAERFGITWVAADKYEAHDQEFALISDGDAVGYGKFRSADARGTGWYNPVLATQRLDKVKWVAKLPAAPTANAGKEPGQC